MTEESAGGVVVRGTDVLLIRDRFGRWTFPKGHVEPGETPKEAAIREVQEETGVQARIRGRLGRVGYALAGGNDKQVTYFLMAYLGGDVTPLQSEISEARWLSFDEAQEHLRTHGYPGYRVLLRRAQKICAG